LENNKSVILGPLDFEGLFSLFVLGGLNRKEVDEL
jgi:hypothetical protein